VRDLPGRGGVYVAESGGRKVEKTNTGRGMVRRR